MLFLVDQVFNEATQCLRLVVENLFADLPVMIFQEIANHIFVESFGDLRD